MITGNYFIGKGKKYKKIIIGVHTCHDCVDNLNYGTLITESIWKWVKRNNDDTGISSIGWMKGENDDPGIKQQNKDLFSSQKEISQLLSAKTALEKLNGDIRANFTAEKMPIRSLENNLAQKEKETTKRIEEIQMWKTRAKQFKSNLSSSQKEISQLSSQKTILENLLGDIREKFTTEMTRSSTLVKNLNQKELEIVKHKEEIHMLKNGAKQFENDFSSSQKEISKLSSEKTALEKLVGDIRAELTEEMRTISTLENNFIQQEKETIRHIEEINMWNNRAK